ncbi:hypothetical protein DCM91_10360 [Chitinophaga costaii]|nr:hypothetical protein DCM91_10360 [Chitinophaga costaii]
MMKGNRYIKLATAIILPWQIMPVHCKRNGRKFCRDFYVVQGKRGGAFSNDVATKAREKVARLLSDFIVIKLPHKVYIFFYSTQIIL